MLGSALAAGVLRQKAKKRETDLVLVRVTAHGVGRLLSVRLLALERAHGSQHGHKGLNSVKVTYLGLHGGCDGVVRALDGIAELLSQRLL